MENEDLKLPKTTSGDIAHALAKAGLSAIPLLGGSAAELLQYVIQSPIEKRREKWMTTVGAKLQELERRGLNLEELQNNEQFISIVMHATQISLRTHKMEKLDALRNALLNVALGQAPDDILQTVFLNLIDSFTTFHLQLLKLFQEPTLPININMGTLLNVIQHNLPELCGNRDICDQIWKDLYSRGLVDTENIHTTMTNHGLGQKRTTNMGDSFIKFIEETHLD